MVHLPALVIIQHSRNPPVSISAVFGSQFSDIIRQPDFFARNQWMETLRGSGLAKYPAGPPFGDSKNLANMIGYLAPP
jgi:hypothetical protein